MSEHLSAATPQHQLEQLIERLRRDDVNVTVLRTELAELAQWRLACGDLMTAARLQRLALSPEEHQGIRDELKTLRQAVVEMEDQSEQGDLRAIPGPWLQVFRHLQRGEYRQAAALQAHLLRCGPSERPEPEMLNRLLQRWLQAGWGAEALNLVEAAPLELDPSDRTAVAIAWWKQELTFTAGSDRDGMGAKISESAEPG